MLITHILKRGTLMANELDEVTGPTNQEGRDVNVIEKQLNVEIGAGTKLLEVAIWVLGFPLAFLLGFIASEGDITVATLSLILGVVPGLIWLLLKVNARAMLLKLQQKIQADASQIDNYLEQRVVILTNLASLLERSIDLDKDVMKTVAAYRSGINPGSDIARNNAGSNLDSAFMKINVAFEAYPELRAQENIAEAMRQNSYLQKEITAARTLYNDSVTMWNQEIFSWPINQLVAAKAGYKTRIPFTASQETKAAARGNFF
jgi:LemA protein